MSMGSSGRTGIVARARIVVELVTPDQSGQRRTAGKFVRRGRITGSGAGINYLTTGDDTTGDDGWPPARLT